MIEKKIRYRINVSTSVMEEILAESDRLVAELRKRYPKGIETPDCTVDGEGFSMEEILAESDRLVAELRKRYPVAIPEPKAKS